MANDLQQVQQALQAGDKQQALQLLMPMLDSTNADAWALAATLFDDPKMMLGAVKNALAIDPQHAQANALMGQMRQMFGDQLAQMEQDMQQNAAGMGQMAADMGFGAQTQAAASSTGASAWDRPYDEASAEAFEAQAEQTRAASDDEESDLYGNVQPTGNTGAGTYQMLWNCAVCGTEKLLGVTHRFCPNCGTQQDPDWRYFPAEDEYVRVENHVFVGKDLTCSVCGTLNAADANFCENCGSTLEDAEPASSLGEQRMASGRAFPSSGSRDEVAEQWQRQMNAIDEKAKGGGIPMRTVVILGLVALVAVGAFIAVFWTQEARVTATAHSWERTIVVDEYRFFTTQNWDDMRPAGDQVTRGTCVERQRGSRQVPDGQECETVRVDNGDGTFSTRQECRTVYRSEPVYDDWCTYSGYRWEFDRNVTTSGNSVSDTPTWGDPNLNCANQRSTGCEREARREEQYIVQFTSNSGDNSYDCAFEQPAWRDVALNSEWRVQVRVIDPNAALCDTLVPMN